KQQPAATVQQKSRAFMQRNVFRAQMMSAPAQQGIVPFDPLVSGQKVIRKHADGRAPEPREGFNLEFDLDTGQGRQLFAGLAQRMPMAFFIEPMRARYEDVEI